MSSTNVFLISNDSFFTRRLRRRWQHEITLPALRELRPEEVASAPGCELALIAGVTQAALGAVLAAVEAKGGRAVACVENRLEATLMARFPAAIFLHRAAASSELLVRLAAEILRGAEADRRAARAEQHSAAEANSAALGRCFREVQHGLNNALAGMLGNAELLLLDSAPLPEPTRTRLDMIHSMALRLHADLQRVSSVDTAVRMARNTSQVETTSSAAAPGTVHAHTADANKGFEQQQLSRTISRQNAWPGDCK